MTYEWTTVMHTCSRCMASWTAPRDQPHKCAVEAAETRVADAESVLRELHANSSGQIEDPHFRHWAAVTIASYFSAQSAILPDPNDPDWAGYVDPKGLDHVDP